VEHSQAEQRIPEDGAAGEGEDPRPPLILLEVMDADQEQEARDGAHEQEQGHLALPASPQDLIGFIHSRILPEGSPNLRRGNRDPSPDWR